MKIKHALYFLFAFIIYSVAYFVAPFNFTIFHFSIQNLSPFYFAAILIVLAIFISPALKNKKQFLLLSFQSTFLFLISILITKLMEIFRILGKEIIESFKPFIFAALCEKLSLILIVLIAAIVILTAAFYCLFRYCAASAR